LFERESTVLSYYLLIADQNTNKESTVSLFTQIFLIVAGNLISNNHGELFTFALFRFFLNWHNYF